MGPRKHRQPAPEDPQQPAGCADAGHIAVEPDNEEEPAVLEGLARAAHDTDEGATDEGGIPHELQLAEQTEPAQQPLHAGRVVPAPVLDPFVRGPIAGLRVNNGREEGQEGLTTIWIIEVTNKFVV